MSEHTISNRPYPPHGDSSSYDDGTFAAGDVVLAAVRNPIENAKSKGKNRPFVLVKRVGGHWCGMGLTTNQRYGNGAPRVAVPDPSAVGLQGPGFLWGGQLTSVSVLDIQDVILGVVDHALAEAVISLAGLEPADAVALRQAAGSESSAA